MTSIEYILRAYYRDIFYEYMQSIGAHDEYFMSNYRISIGETRVI